MYGNIEAKIKKNYIIDHSEYSLYSIEHLIKLTDQSSIVIGFYIAKLHQILILLKSF